MWRVAVSLPHLCESTGDRLALVRSPPPSLPYKVDTSRPFDRCAACSSAPTPRGSRSRPSRRPSQSASRSQPWPLSSAPSSSPGRPRASSRPRRASPPPPPSRTDWTRLVHPPVLTGHAAGVGRQVVVLRARSRRRGRRGRPDARRAPSGGRGRLPHVHRPGRGPRRASPPPPPPPPRARASGRSLCGVGRLAHALALWAQVLEHVFQPILAGDAVDQVGPARPPRPRAPRAAQALPLPLLLPLPPCPPRRAPAWAWDAACPLCTG